MHRFLATLLVSLLATGSAWAAGCDAPPPTIHPAAAPNLPDAAAAFAGIWQGQWPVAIKDRVVPICARLYVNVSAPQTATIEQCTGSSREAKRKAECKQFVAQIDGNLMTFSDLQGTVYSFTMADVGGMKAEAVSASHRSGTVFMKPE